MQTAIGRNTTPDNLRGRRSLGQRIWAARWCYIMMVPGTIMMIGFSLYPILGGWYFSLFNWDGIGNPTQFVGLMNYLALLHDSFFWSAVARSLWFAAVTTPVELVVGLLLAIVLNDRALRLGVVFRTLFFIPVVTTTAIASIVMSIVFAAYGGPINQVLQGLHLTRGPIGFLANPRGVMWTAMLIFVWKWVGQPMIYWLAGLQTIPAELYEAAHIDGARWWDQVRHVTAPLLAPFAAIIALIVGLGNLQVFAFLQALTGGGPYFATETMELFIFRTAFGTESNGLANSNPEFGYGSAAGVLFGVMLMLAVGIQFIVIRRVRGSVGGPRARR